MDYIIDTVINPLLHAVLTALAAAALAVVVRYLQKMGISLDAQKHYRLQEIATGAVLFAEEFIESRLKASGAPALNKGAEKAAIAVTQILDKVPNISRQEAEQLAKEAVARVGLGATDLLGKAAAAAKS